MPNQGGTDQKNAASGKGRQRREESSGTYSPAGEIPALVDAQKNSPVWEYESPNFQVASSLPALSLLISESPTQPEIESRGKATRRLPRIDEIDTVPSLNQARSIESSRALVPTASRFEVATFDRPGETALNVLASKENKPSSWTAGAASQSSYARLISSRSKRKKHRPTISLNPIDRVRWWLLRPGRIEFVLWLGGTVLLVSVTCVLLLVTAFSFEWLTPGFSGASSTNMAGTSTGPQQQATVTAAGGLILTRTDTGPLLPGQSIHLHGQGFSLHGHIKFLFDGSQPILDQYGKSDSTQADAQGVFSTTLRLNDNLPWHPGPHFIAARDLATNRVATVAFDLAPGPIGKGVSSTPVPSAGITPTPIQGGKPTPVPVGQTPVPVTPTPHPGTPTVTPTVGTTPTVTPTVGATPTVMPTVGTTPGVTPTAGHSASGGSSLGNALSRTADPSLGKQLTNLNPWIWVMSACYSLSMVLLGLAGVLHKHRR
jgi:hypothetical protein